MPQASARAGDAPAGAPPAQQLGPCHTPPRPPADPSLTLQRADPAAQAAQFDLAITLLLHRWPVLTTAVTNQWGGPDSADKRDWLAGALSEQFAADPATDPEDVEVLLLQVMEDEFGARLEDDSEVEVAAEMVRVRRQLYDEGDTSGVDALRRWWDARRAAGKKDVVIAQGAVPGGADDEEWDDDDDDDDDGEEDGGVDVDMGDAPPLLVPARQKAVPEVDEDGFTKVVGKRRR